MGYHVPQPEYHPGYYNLEPRILPPRLTYRLDRFAARVCWRIKAVRLYGRIYRTLYRWEFREYRPRPSQPSTARPPWTISRRRWG